MAFDVISPAPLGRGAISASPTVTTFRTTPANSRDMLKSIDISNTSASIAQVTVYIVPSGGSPGSDNVLVPNVDVPGYGIFQWTGTQMLTEGDTIQATASKVGVAFHASGAECV